MSRRGWDRSFLALFGLMLVLLLGAGRVLALPASQGEPDFAAIDGYVASQQDRLGIPGLALGIVRGDQIAHLQGFGVADGAGRPVTPQTPFYLGSVTKSFTALAVMQLVEAGRIDLDAPVQIYLPWFRLADEEASARVTVRNLLNQDSGISERDGNSLWRSGLGLEETVRGLGNIRLTRSVGSTYQYSNLNYVVLGLIVEQVSGQSYGEYVAQHIFQPLAMDHAHASREAALADGLAEGHLYVSGLLLPDEGPIPPSMLPAGFLMASVEDLSHYMIAQLNEGRYGQSSILSPQAMAELHAPAVPTRGGDAHYAMGWNAGTLDDMRLIWHNGDAGRNHSIIILVPDRGWGIVLLGNASGFEQSSYVDDVAVGVVSMLSGEPPRAVSVPVGLRLAYWGIPAAVLLQMVGLVIVWRNRRRIPAWGVVLVVMANLALVTGVLTPSQARMTIPSLTVFYPDVGYGLVAVAVLGIGWSLFYAVASLVQRRWA